MRVSFQTPIVVSSRHCGERVLAWADGAMIGRLKNIASEALSYRLGVSQPARSVPFLENPARNRNSVQIDLIANSAKCKTTYIQINYILLQTDIFMPYRIMLIHCLQTRGNYFFLILYTLLISRFNM
jgi:hypothetical protein